MSFNEDLFEFDEEEMSNPTDIKVVGVGGGGNNAVSRMKQLGIRGVEFLAVNTDTQDLQNAQCDETIQIGEKITNGLGSGAQPKVGLKSAQESRDKIKQSLEGADLLFLTAGMGGGTGTGASPVIAELAQELDILTVGVVTRPFEFEGQQRSKKAEAGIESLRDVVDTLIIVPNQRIFDVVDDDDIPLEDAFRKADEVLFHGVHGISEIIIEDGIMNVDFADVRTVMEERGDALMGIGEASGEDRAINAAEQALDCPLLETNEITGAQGVLTNITGSKESLSAQAVREINELVNSRADSEAEVICGTVKDQELGDTLRVTVIATGFPHSERQGSSSSGRAAGSTDPTDRENVIDYDNIDSNKKFKEEPAVERKEQGGDVEIVNSNPTSAEETDEEDGDDDDDFDVPTFMRVS